MKIDDDLVRFRLELPLGDWNSQGSLRDSAVLALLVEREGVDRLVFNRRRDDLPFHAGQICFPGGAREGEEDAVACALRETEEEMGVGGAHIEVLGRLPIGEYRRLQGRLLRRAVAVDRSVRARAERGGGGLRDPPGRVHAGRTVELHREPPSTRPLRPRPLLHPRSPPRLGPHRHHPPRLHHPSPRLRPPSLKVPIRCRSKSGTFAAAAGTRPPRVRLSARVPEPKVPLWLRLGMGL
ncbi:MAG: CoA pyrophosphatase [Planctomycetes bacterium]|nr:CoA pyrophosphatase [Planctomycetota bacterium]